MLPWVETLQVGMDSGWLVRHMVELCGSLLCSYADYCFSNMQLALVHIPISYGFCALQIDLPEQSKSYSAKLMFNFFPNKIALSEYQKHRYET